MCPFLLDILFLFKTWYLSGQNFSRFYGVVRQTCHPNENSKSAREIGPKKPVNAKIPNFFRRHSRDFRRELKRLSRDGCTLLSESGRSPRVHGTGPTISQSLASEG